MNAVDVLDTVKEEYRARRDLLKAQYDFITSVLVLHRWSGTLVDEDIHKANEWLVAGGGTLGALPLPAMAHLHHRPRQLSPCGNRRQRSRCAAPLARGAASNRGMRKACQVMDCASITPGKIRLSRMSCATSLA